MTIHEMLRATYDPPEGRAREWLGFEEVTLGSRRMDFLALNLWYSRGHEIRGHEVKEQRGDWLRELKDPAKADGLAAFVDTWWVAAPADVVLPEELPVGWGLMVPARKRLKIAREAAKRESVVTPQLRQFLIVLLRHAATVQDSERQRLREEARREVQKHAVQDVESVTRRLGELGREVKEFEDATGISIPWGRQGDAAALKEFLKLRRSAEDAAAVATSARNAVQRHAERLDEMAGELRACVGRIAGVAAEVAGGQP